MTVAAGTRLGVYEVTALLGAGGMGTVYRARDPRLGREVAIKVLPEALAGDPDRLRRFELEARAASALNHPNLLTLYDVGTTEGRPYLVTELLEGSSLREVLESGEPIPLRRALDWAAQIAKGLAAAHEKGIVHRDLKPENLFVRDTGLIKILDFGLAKLRRPESQASAAASPTIAQETEAGVVLGTVGYMAPEQVRGEPADSRADIFAFGCVLYEMLSGRRAFERDTAVETMSAILREEAAPLALVGSGGRVPIEPARVVERCLAKNPDERWQSARDLAYRCEELVAPSGSALASGAMPTNELARGRRVPWPGLLAAAALVLGSFGWFLALRPHPAAEPPLWQRVTFRRGVPTAGRFAPDGKTVLFSEAVQGGVERVYSTRVDSPESTVLALPPGRLLAVSSTGQVALGVPHGESTDLDVAALAGGGARALLEDVTFADWSPDGSRLAVVHDLGDRNVVELPIGTRLYDPGVGWQLSDLRFAPRGDRLAIVELRFIGSGSSTASVVMLDAAGKRSELTHGGFGEIYGLAWRPDGQEVWFTGRQPDNAGALHLYAVTLSGVLRLVSAVPGVVRMQDIAADGRALLMHTLWPETLLCRAPGESRERDLSWLDFSQLVDLSDDGREILIAEGGVAGGGQGGIYLRNVDGSEAILLGPGIPMQLSRDGKWVLARTAGAREQFSLLPTGAGLAQPIAAGDLEGPHLHLMPDGSHLLVRAKNADGQYRMFLRALADGVARPMTNESVGYGAVSPDGTTLAASTAAGWRLIALDGTGGSRPLLGTSPDDDVVRFDRSGRALFVGRKTSDGLQIDRLDVATGARQALYRLTPEASVGSVVIQGRAVSADGGSYCYSYLRDISDLYLASGLR
ncbi:MAG: protein kinase [Acidobacteriota bacterium]